MTDVKLAEIKAIRSRLGHLVIEQKSELNHLELKAQENHNEKEYSEIMNEANICDEIMFEMEGVLSSMDALINVIEERLE